MNSLTGEKESFRPLKDLLFCIACGRGGGGLLGTSCDTCNPELNGPRASEAWLADVKPTSGRRIRLFGILAVRPHLGRIGTTCMMPVPSGFMCVCVWIRTCQQCQDGAFVGEKSAATPPPPPQTAGNLPSKIPGRPYNLRLLPARSPCNR